MTRVLLVVVFLSVSGCAVPLGDLVEELDRGLGNMDLDDIVVVVEGQGTDWIVIVACSFFVLVLCLALVWLIRSPLE